MGRRARQRFRAASPSADTTTGGGHTGHKPKPTIPVDLTPVTDTVTDVVNGVVNGVNGLLNGLTGQTGTGGPTVP